MRSLLTGEQALALSGDHDVYIKLVVENGSGTPVDVGAALGTHWVINARWGETLDTPVSQATFTLVQQIGANSLAPLIATSALNVLDDGVTYSPLLDVGRSMWAYSATVPRGAAFNPSTTTLWRPCFTGRIDTYSQADSVDMMGPITITCSDLGGWLMDAQIETPDVSYGSDAGQPLEDVLNAVIAGTVDPAYPVTVVKASASLFAKYTYKQDAVKVMEALQSLVLDNLGEDIRYRFDASHVSQLTWFDPRTHAVGDFDATLGTEEYIVPTLTMDLAPVRNAFAMDYYDEGGTGESGTVTSGDLASESKVRRRFNRIGLTPMIATALEAQKVVDACNDDLAGEPVDATTSGPFLWFAQLYDRYKFTANSRQYTDDQILTIVGYQHAVENGRASTTLTVTGRIMGAYAAWLRKIAPNSAVERSLNILRVNSRESADGKTRDFTVLVGTRVTTLFVHYRTVAITETQDRNDFSDTAVLPVDSGSPLVLRPAARLVTFTLPQPVRETAMVLRLVPMASNGLAGDSVLVTVDAAPPGINATIHATKVGATARLSIEIEFGPSDGPVSVAVIERVVTVGNPTGTPVTLLTLPMDTPATIDWTTHIELDARAIPKEADSVSWTVVITDIANNAWTFGPTYALPSAVLITPTFVESAGSATVTVVVVDAGGYLDKLHVDGAITRAISWHVTRDGVTSIVDCTTFPTDPATSGTYTRTETLAPLHPVQVAGFIHYVDGDTECFGVWPFDSLKIADVVNTSVGNTPTTATVKVTWDSDALIGSDTCRYKIGSGSYSTAAISGAYLTSFDIARTSSKQTITMQAKNMVDGGATWGNEAIVDVDEFETGSVYNQCLPTITSYDDTTVTVTVTATSTLGTPTVGLVGFIGCTLASGHAAGTYTYAQNGTDNVWVFNRAAAGSGEVGQAIFRAYYAGAQTDDGQAPIPIIGGSTIFLAIQARVIASTATTATVRVAVSDPEPQGTGTGAITYVEAGGTGTACSPASGAGGPHSDGTVDPTATILPSEAANTYIDYVITRPDFGTGTRQVIFTATALNRASASDPVYVPPVQRESFGPSLTVTPTPGATTYAIAWTGTGTITLTTDNGATWAAPGADAHATAGASPLTGIARPTAGSVPTHYLFKAVADSQTVTDDIAIPPIDKDTVTPNLTVTPSSPTELTQVFTAAASNPTGGTAPTIVFTLYGCTADGGTLIADIEHAYSAPITIDRPVWGIATQASVTFTAAIAGGGSETISRTILNQLRDTNNINRVTSSEDSTGAWRDFTLTVGTRTTQVHAHYRTVLITETGDTHDFSDTAVLAVDSGSPLVKAAVANVVTFALPQPQRGYMLAARFVPYDVSGNEGASVPLTIDAAPPAINAVIHATKSGATADLSIDIAFGPSDGPVSVSAIESLIGTAVAPNTLATWTMTAPGTVDLSTVPALGSRPIPADADSVSWTVEITDVSGSVWRFPGTAALPSAVLIVPTAIENTTTHECTVTLAVVDSGDYLNTAHVDTAVAPATGGPITACISWHVTNESGETVKDSDTKPMSGTTGGYIITEPLSDLHSVKIDGYAHYVDGSTELFGSWTFDSNKIADVVNVAVANSDTTATVTVVWDSDARMAVNACRYTVDGSGYLYADISNPERLSSFNVARTSANQTVVVQAKNEVDAGATWGNESTIEIDAYLGYSLSATPTEAAGVGTVTMVVGDPAALFDAAFVDGAITSQISWHVTRLGVTTVEASTSVPGGGATTGTWTKAVTLDPLHNIIVVAVGHFLAAPTSRVMGAWTFDSNKVSDVVNASVANTPTTATVTIVWDTDTYVNVTAMRYSLDNGATWTSTEVHATTFLSQFNVTRTGSKQTVIIQAKNAIDPTTWGNQNTVEVSATEAGTIYNECRATVTSSNATTVTVTVTAASTIGTPTVGLVGFTGCTLLSGHALGTYTYAQNGTDNVWVFTRAAFAAGVGQAEFRAVFAGAQSDDDFVTVPEQGRDTIYTECLAKITSVSATQVTVTVSANVASGTPTVGFVAVTGNATLASGHTAGTYTYAINGSDNVWVFNRPAVNAAGMGQAQFRAVTAGAQNDDDFVDIPEVGRDTVALLMRARVTATTPTTVTVRVSVADPYPQGAGSATILYAETGGTGAACSPAQGGTVTPAATSSEAAGTYIEYTVTRPAFGTGARRVTFIANAANRTSDSDAVDVPEVDRDTVFLAMRARITASTATTATVRVAVADPICVTDPQTVTIVYVETGGTGTACSPASGGTVTPAATITEAGGTYIDYTVTRPATGTGTRRVTFTATATGRTSDSDAVDIPALEQKMWTYRISLHKLTYIATGTPRYRVELQVQRGSEGTWTDWLAWTGIGPSIFWESVQAREFGSTTDITVTEMETAYGDSHYPSYFEFPADDTLKYIFNAHTYPVSDSGYGTGASLQLVI